MNSVFYGYAHARDLGHSNFFYIALCNLLSLSLQTYYMYCDVPNKGKKLPRSADGPLGVSKGFPTPLTSSLMPPKPPRTKVREDAWRKNEICMFIRLLKPSESKKKKENHREGGEVRTPISTTRKL